MIPVINLKKIQAYNESLTPEERRQNQKRSRELLQAAMQSVEECKRICEEKGIPYVGCVAAKRVSILGYNR